jgi:hypothetical protein
MVRRSLCGRPRLTRRSPGYHVNAMIPKTFLTRKKLRPMTRNIFRDNWVHVPAVASASQVTGSGQSAGGQRRSRWVAMSCWSRTVAATGTGCGLAVTAGSYRDSSGHGQHRHVRGQADPERRAARGPSTGSGAPAGTIRRTAHYGVVPSTQAGQVRKAISSALPMSVALATGCPRSWSGDGPCPGTNDHVPGIPDGHFRLPGQHPGCHFAAMMSKTFLSRKKLHPMT